MSADIPSLRQRVLISTLLSCGAAIALNTAINAVNSANMQQSQLLNTANDRAQWYEVQALRSRWDVASEPIGGERIVWLDEQGQPLISADTELLVSENRGALNVYDPLLNISYLGVKHVFSRSVELPELAELEPSAEGAKQDQTETPALFPTNRIAAAIVLMPSAQLLQLRAQNALSFALSTLLSLALGLASAGLITRQHVRELRELEQEVSEMPSDRASIKPVVERGTRELRHVRRTINRIIQHLHDVLKRQDSLMSDISHELRSPIAAIKGHAQLILRRYSPDERSTESLEVIVRESERMSRLIEQLMSLMRAGHGGPQPEDFSWRALSEDVWTNHPLRLSGLTCAITGDAPGYGQRERLSQVLINALNNAAQAGATHVDIELHAGARQVDIHVIDNGKGIEPEHASKVFERFYRADHSRERATGGAGLGLSIAQAIIQAHGGSIELRSAGAGLGAGLYINLPTKNKAKGEHS